MNARQPEVERLLAKLNVLPDRAAEVSRLANDICSMANLARFDEYRPGSVRVGTERAIGELDDLKAATKELTRVLASLHLEADEALHGQGMKPSPYLLVDELRKLYGAASAAQATIRNSPRSKARQGRPPKQAVIDVTEFAAWMFEYLTGKPAARTTDTNRPSGTFYWLLDELFQVLGLDANADGMAKAAISVRGRK